MNNTKAAIRGNRVELHCKPLPEAFVSEYEYKRLRYMNFDTLLLCENQRQGLVFSGNASMTVGQMMVRGIKASQLTQLVKQLQSLWSFTQRNAFRFQQVVFHPDFVYYDNRTDTFRMIYYPVVGEPSCYNMGLFLIDVISASDMAGGEKQRWITATANAAYQERPDWDRLFGELLGGGGVSYSDRADDDEAPTGFEGGYDDEMPTGFEQHGSFYQDEPPTGFEERSYGFNDEPPTGYDDSATQSDDEMPTGYSDTDEELTSFGSYEQRGGYGYVRPMPSVVRRRTGEAQRVECSRFVIGRSRQRANFCINDNSKISNVHAIIMERNGCYYLMDNESKNGTFVSGRKLSGGMQVELSNGMPFQIYDEDFVFVTEEIRR